MDRFFEGLECRSLLSASALTIAADEAKLLTDAKATVAVVDSAVATYRTDASTLAADIKALPHTRTNTALLGKLTRDQLHAAALVTADGQKLVTLDQATVRRAVAGGLADYADPTAANNARLAKAITTAQAIAAKPLATLETALKSSSTAINADLSALAAANPSATQLNTDVATAQADRTSIVSSVQTHVNTLQLDLSNLVTDL